AQWITNTAPDEKNVIEHLRDGTKVWLYLTGQGDIVGYGSLGITTWKYPEPLGSEKATIAVIPAVAVSSAFQSQPPGDWRQRYSTEILSDLIATATQDHLTGRFPDPVLGLFVDARNGRAKKLYTRVGFTDYGKPFKRDGYYDQRMRIKLDVSAIANSGQSTTGEP
ncbi:MAG TPA: hypothetical protein VMV29_09055, partial [Ktedonobacterales bacterium]|nr:hypothetical protein [Ktedonobacterales bacterium]